MTVVIPSPYRTYAVEVYPFLGAGSPLGRSEEGCTSKNDELRNSSLC